VLCVQWAWSWSSVGGAWTRNGLKCHTKKFRDSQWGRSTTWHKKIQLSFTASNIATVDYSVLSFMMNKNIGTTYSVDRKHFLFIWPSCPNGFSLLVQQCPAPKVKNWGSSSSFPLKYETAPKLWKFPFVFEAEGMKCKNKEAEAEGTKCKNKDHPPYLCKGLV